MNGGCPGGFDLPGRNELAVIVLACGGRCAIGQQGTGATHQVAHRAAVEPGIIVGHDGWIRRDVDGGGDAAGRGEAGKGEGQGGKGAAGQGHGVRS